MPELTSGRLSVGLWRATKDSCGAKPKTSINKAAWYKTVDALQGTACGLRFMKPAKRGGWSSIFHECIKTGLPVDVIVEASRVRRMRSQLNAFCEYHGYKYATSAFVGGVTVQIWSEQ